MSVLYHIKLLILVLFTFGSLSGCSGGGGGAGGVGDGGGDNAGTPGSTNTPPVVTLPPNDSPGGIWIGTVTSTQTGEILESIALVTETGKMRLITENSKQIAGDVTVNEKAFTGEITAYAPFELLVYVKGDIPVTGTVTGTVHQRSTFAGSTSLNDFSNSSFNFTYNAARYEKPSSLALLSGNYSIADGEGHTLTISIDAAGIITGSDNGVMTGGAEGGCVMNGVAELLDTKFNMYHLQIKTTDCGELDGNFRGPASLFQVDAPHDTLVFSLECVRFLIAGKMSRA